MDLLLLPRSKDGIPAGVLSTLALPCKKNILAYDPGRMVLYFLVSWRRISGKGGSNASCTLILGMVAPSTAHQRAAPAGVCSLVVTMDMGTSPHHLLYCGHACVAPPPNAAAARGTQPQSCNWSDNHQSKFGAGCSWEPVLVLCMVGWILGRTACREPRHPEWGVDAESVVVRHSTIFLSSTIVTRDRLIARMSR